MQRDRGTGGTEDMKGLQQQQARSPKPLQPDIQQQKQAQKKCPRCDSLNTKFCYYNNYSLSQPRYFCKSCRRYWTQGGTLRNIPVGGGFRREKRHKIASSADEPPDQTQPQLQQAPCSAIDRISCSTGGILTSSSPNLWIQDAQNMASPVIAPLPSTTCIYHPCGGLFSSLAAIQSFNHPNIGSDFGKSPNLDLLRGFSLSSSSSSQRHLQQQSQISQRGDGDENVHHLFPSEGNLLEPNSPTSHQEWNRSFINTSNSMCIDPGYRSSIHSATTSTTTTVTGSSFNASQWPDIPGYGPPPSSSTSHL